ncbi:MAG: hypothetical protein LBS73_03705 [Campylobacteraceae bacterium]|jgi:cytochrome c553|nr:hypothetical protein [Campylobacteraceae bacterium]
MKAGKTIAAFICASLAVFMVYIFLTKEGGYISSDEIAAAQSEPQSAAEGINEQEKQLFDLQKSVAEVGSKKTSHLYASKCSACHGKNGEGRFSDKGEIIFPKIAGLKQTFILQRLELYKQGSVPNPLMKPLLTNINDEDLKLLSLEVSRFEMSDE